MSAAGQTATEQVVERALWLAIQPHPVLAFQYLPGEGRAARTARTAVLFCPTFGWEEMCSYRGRRIWAQMLARAGYPAVTFSLPGSGDSGGSPRDSGQLESWTSAVAEAAIWLTDATGAERVCAIGIGMGGLLAFRAVASGAPIDDLVLWSTPAEGRRWLREMRTYAGMVASRRPEDHRPEDVTEGEFGYIGFLLTGETAAEIGAVRLTDLDFPRAGDRRVLLLGRDGLSPDARLSDHLERAGSAVTVMDTDDYGTLMLHPQEARAPIATIDKTIAWLSSSAAAAPASSARSLPRSRPDGPPGGLERSTVELRWNGTDIRETALSLDGADGETFAVLTEGIDVDPAAVCAVWLNGGALRHTGPNRVWVEAARRWASRGVPTVRVDLPGIGDSGGEEGCVSNRDLYDPRRTHQTLAVLDQLAGRGLPDRYVLGGLCSGAYWSLHAALADPRVAGTLLINLYAFFWSEALVAERDTGGSLSALRGYGWRRLAHRDVTLTHLRTVAASLRPTRLRAGVGHPVERSQSAEIELALAKLQDQGTQTLLLFSREEGLYEQLRRQGVLDRRSRWANLTVEEIPSTDHMFRALWLQRHVHASLDRALERVMARVG